MKATIDFDSALYRQLKLEAVRRGRTVKDLVAEGVRLVLAHQPAAPHPPPPDNPAWLGSLRRFSSRANAAHDLVSVRKSIARGRTAKTK